LITYGESLTPAPLALVSVVQRECATKNPREILGRSGLAGRPGDVNHMSRKY
jgi:hypothetical protein